MVDALQSAAQRMMAEESNRFEEALAESAPRWEVLGGDPLSNDWSRFRPLRLGREEDWSDWLAHLLESSSTGAFARSLLHPSTRGQGSVTSWQGQAGREQPTSGGHRTDIRFEPQGVSFHVEVKVGDKQFEKTFPTADQVEAEGSQPWVHLILLPEEDLDAWFACEGEKPRRIKVGVLTWRDVARALREASGDEAEPLAWRVWAWSFCGALEQRLLGHPVVLPDKKSPRIQSIADLGGALSVIRLLKEVRRGSE
ncbi:hypothetical protein [Hyalangium gracile]|uniref:hypothetical protein n=1 Tax=Hyalangium gracile TaxID=394092 RepID=UPI001CCD948B|nr:hypothetical protein [Hyalangium gracile]